MGFPDGSDSKESACNVGDLGSIPGLRRSPGGGHGNPLQYSHLENPMDRGAWQTTVHSVLKNQTRLSNWAHSGLLRELKELLKLSHKKPFFGRSFLDIITRWMTLNNRKLTSSGTGKFQQHNSFPSTKKNLSPFHYLYLPLWVKTLLSTNIS